MFAARGPARVGGKTRATRATLALIITLTAGAVAASGTASASPISAKRAEAQQVQAQIQQAQSSLERQIEAYNRVHDDYDATRTKLQRSRELLGVAKANLGRAQKNLAASLTRRARRGRCPLRQGRRPSLRRDDGLLVSSSSWRLDKPKVPNQLSHRLDIGVRHGDFSLAGQRRIRNGAERLKGEDVVFAEASVPERTRAGKRGPDGGAAIEFDPMALSVIEPKRFDR